MNKENNFLDTLNDWGTILTNTYEDSTTFTIPNNIVDIPDYYFSKYIKNMDKKILYIGNHVKSIGQNAFSNTPFGGIAFGDNSQLKSIGNFAFYNSNGLSGKITLPDTIENIGDYAFASTSLSDFNIPKNITALHIGTILNTNFDTLIIPSSVKFIGYSVFNNCFCNHDLVIPPTVEKIEAGAFDGLTVKNIYIPKHIKNNISSIKKGFEPIIPEANFIRYNAKDYNKILERALANKYG